MASNFDPKSTYEQIAADKKQQAVLAGKPHHYGLVSGVHVFHALHDAHKSLIGLHLTDPDEEALSNTLKVAKSDHSTVIIHGSVPTSLRSKGPGCAHPHAYDWHDGHTDYHEDLQKNEQAAGKGVKSYQPIAQHYGNIHPGKKTNLQHYPKLDHAEPKIDKLIEKHGFQTYMAGGKYGKPDLANKNYNTKHLMVYDPTPASGGDFGNEAQTRTWRKIHELAHALTYPDINKLYGEGRRIGKLGTRSPKEAKRAVHWEWLATHKQRELAQEVGIDIPDEDFSRELNTVMHDSVHRAITGKFTEPSDEGFEPHPAPVSLEHSLNLVEQHSKALGLDHDEQTNASVASPKSTMDALQSIKKTDLTKAFTMGDNETLVDPRAHYAAAGSVPEALMGWGAKHLVPMKPDTMEIFQLGGKVLKIRKLIDDLYSGFIEHDAAIIHSFERITMPELLGQVQSKLQMYTNEEQIVNEASPKAEEEPSKEIKEEIKEKIQELKDKIEETAEVVSAKELVPGIENPEKECPACENSSEKCVCYTGLSAPRVEFDGKKFTFFFKSEWNEDDRSNFVDDLKRRAGLVAQKRIILEARKTLTTLKKKLGN